MSKFAALLFVLALSAGACSTTEPQTIVAVVPAAESDAAAPEATGTTDSAPTSDNEEERESSTASASTVPEGTAPSTSAPATNAETAAPSTIPASPTVADLLSGALAKDGEQLSARFNGGVSIAANIEGESVNLAIDMSGAFDAATGSAEFTMDLSSIGAMIGEESSGSEMAMFEGMFDEPVEMKMIGGTAYVKWSLFDMFTGTEGMWLEMELEDADIAGLGGLTGPTDLMSMLDGVDGEVIVIGTETISGVDATHYEVRLDMNSFAGELGDLDLDPAAAKELASITEMFPDLPLHIWIDTDGRLRRVEITVSSDVLADLIGPADSFNAMIWYEISDYGSDITITAPPADKVVSGDSIDFF
jgi:hypothetical protein